MNYFSDGISEYLDNASASLLAMLKEKKQNDIVSQYNSIFIHLLNQITSISIMRIKFLTEISVLHERNKKLEEKLKHLEDETEEIQYENKDLNFEKPSKESKFNIVISEQPKPISRFTISNVNEEKKIGKKSIFTKVSKSPIINDN